MLNLALAKQRREEMGLTLAQLGGLMGVDASTIHSWESGRHEPRAIATLNEWARILNITVADLMTTPNQEAPAQ